MANVKKGDTVLVLTGKDNGKTGKILVSNPSSNTVVVEGVNITAKHKKPKKAGDKGGILKAEGKIDASNVMIVCPSCKKATRVGHKVVDGKKIRICKKCGASLDLAIVKREPKKATTSKVVKASKKVEDTKKVTTTKVAPKKATTTKKITSKSITSATADKRASAKSTVRKSSGK